MHYKLCLVLKDRIRKGNIIPDINKYGSVSLMTLAIMSPNHSNSGLGRIYRANYFPLCQ